MTLGFTLGSLPPLALPEASTALGHQASVSAQPSSSLDAWDSLARSGYSGSCLPLVGQVKRLENKPELQIMFLLTLRTPHSFLGAGQHSKTHFL